MSIPTSRSRVYVRQGFNFCGGKVVMVCRDSTAFIVNGDVISNYSPTLTATINRTIPGTGEDQDANPEVVGAEEGQRFDDCRFVYLDVESEFVCGFLEAIYRSSDMYAYTICLFIQMLNAT